MKLLYNSDRIVVIVFIIIVNIIFFLSLCYSGTIYTKDKIVGFFDNILKSRTDDNHSNEKSSNKTSMDTKRPRNYIIKNDFKD